MFIACTGFPNCRATKNLPKALTGIRMLQEICKNCLDTSKGHVQLLYLEFEPNLVNETMSEILPFEDNTAGNFCVECDESFQTLLEVTRLLPFRRTFEQAF